MRMRLAALLTPVVIGLALLMPASTAAAAGYTYQIVDQHCIGSGHNIYFRVKLTAAGTTAANKLTIKSKSQYYAAGKWHSSYFWATDKSTFTKNGQAHSIDYSYTHTDNSDTRKWRIVSTLHAWNGTHSLSRKTLTSKAC